MDIKFSITGVMDMFWVILFGVTGVLNLIYIHVVPGIFYLLFALLYVPAFFRWAGAFTGIRVSYVIRMLAAFVLLWATLAVGDLAELYGL